VGDCLHSLEGDFVQTNPDFRGSRTLPRRGQAPLPLLPRVPRTNTLPCQKGDDPDNFPPSTSGQL
jgi:hypothetical protein